MDGKGLKQASDHGFVYRRLVGGAMGGARRRRCWQFRGPLMKREKTELRQETKEEKAK